MIVKEGSFSVVGEYSQSSQLVVYYIHSITVGLICFVLEGNIHASE